jgi:hypothetical protein
LETERDEERVGIKMMPSTCRGRSFLHMVLRVSRRGNRGKKLNSISEEVA